MPDILKGQNAFILSTIGGKQKYITQNYKYVVFKCYIAIHKHLNIFSITKTEIL